MLKKRTGGVPVNFNCPDMHYLCVRKSILAGISICMNLSITKYMYVQVTQQRIWRDNSSKRPRTGEKGDLGTRYETGHDKLVEICAVVSNNCKEELMLTSLQDLIPWKDIFCNLLPHMKHLNLGRVSHTATSQFCMAFCRICISPTIHVVAAVHLLLSNTIKEAMLCKVEHYLTVD